MIFLDFINGCSSQNHSGIINTCDSRTMHTSPLGRVVPTSDEQTLPFRRWLARKGEGNSVQSTSRGTVVTRLRNTGINFRLFCLIMTSAVIMSPS